MSGIQEILRIPGMKKFFLARTISNFGNGLGPIALAFGVLGMPDGNASKLSFVMAAQMLPMVVFMLAGGVIADRFPRALVIGSTDTILSLLVIFNGITFLTNTVSIPQLVIVAFFSGVLNAMWYPAFAGLMPELVPEDKLQKANSVISLGSNASNIVGVVFGGVLVAAVGSGLAIIFDGLTFLTAGALVLSLRKNCNPIATNEASHSMWRDLHDGWKEFISHSWVVAVVLGYTIIAGIMEAVFAVLGPFHAKTILSGPKPWALIMASLSLGMALGVVLTMKVKPYRPIVAGLLANFGFVAWLLVMGLSTNVPLIMFSSFLAGIGMDFFMVLWSTALQQNIQPEALSRVASYDAFGSLVLAPFTMVIAGPLAQKYGSAPSLISLGVLMAIVLAILITVPGVRHLINKDRLAEAGTSASV